MTARRPPALRPGMRLGVVSPSSAVLEPSRMRRGLAAIEALGFEVVLGDEVGQTYGYLAGTDRARADGFLAMLERDDVDGVICLRGGYGAMRTVQAMDLQRLRRLSSARPKVFVGFSDITVLHALLARELSWVTFYGPMVTTFSHASDYVVDAFRRAVMEPAPVEIRPDPDDPYTETLVPGRAEGVLVGGCLSLLSTLVGTPYEPELDGRILFFEDVDAQPDEVDRSLTHLLATGRLQRCAGIVVGEHAGCAPTEPGPTLGLEQVLEDLVVPLGIPAMYHLPIGHGRHLATVPLGVPAVLDAGARRLWT
ncbi:MAG: S66 peptidase family protein, partial [Acidimicrobiales bacterium]